jgi:hypothetical protein
MTIVRLWTHSVGSDDRWIAPDVGNLRCPLDGVDAAYAYTQRLLVCGLPLAACALGAEVESAHTSAPLGAARQEGAG